MNRGSLDLDTVADFYRQQMLASVAAGADNDLPPEERSDRPDVCPGTVLKVGDDVEVYAFIKARIIGAARGLTSFATYRFEPSNGGHCIEQWPWMDITDRAPADPNEAPGTNAPEEPFSVALPAPSEPPPGAP